METDTHGDAIPKCCIVETLFREYAIDVQKICQKLGGHENRHGDKPYFYASRSITIISIIHKENAYTPNYSSAQSSTRSFDTPRMWFRVGGELMLS